MRKLHFLVFILFLTAKIYPQEGLSNNLMGVCFTDADNGTVVGDYNGKGVILRTTNAGTNWITKYTGESCRAVSFTDANIGTAVGYDGIILRTTDGGNTWNNQVSGTTNTLNAVSFCDADNGIAVGGGTILKTIDGGKYWVNTYNKPGYFSAVSFIDSITATVVGANWEGANAESILRTTDGGNSWFAQESGKFHYLYDVCFTDANTGTAVGEGGTILRTINGGETWINQSSGTKTMLTGVSFIDANNGYITGFSWGQPGIILKTTDGGTQWVSQSIGITQLYDVCFTDANTGTIVGYDENAKRNAILRTTDGGEHWVNQLTAQSDTGITISGSVKYDNNEPAQYIYVQLYGVNSANTYYTYTDVLGNYSVQVNKDSYYIYAKVPYNLQYASTHRLKYYDNKSSLSEADLLEVNNDINNIDFTFPVLQHGTISGKVRDAKTLQPLSQTYLEFYSAEQSDSNFAITDQDGNYSLEIFEGRYIISAIKFWGYYRQFYKNAYNPFDATPIIISSDNLNVTGIDFDLTTPEPGTNIIRGQVRDNAGYFISNVQVYAIPLSGGNWIETKTDYRVGEYMLRDLKNGEYVLLFYKDGYKSEYYNNVFAWEDAYVFNLTGNENISVNDVVLDSLNSFGGEVSGNVSSNSGALSATLLSAVNSSGKVVSSTLSGFNGNYLIPSLENGSYKIKASKIGYASCEYSGEVQIDLINNPVADGINISINLTAIDEEENIIPEFFELHQNYPNPFNPTTSIEYRVGSIEYVTLKVYDVLGNEVATLVSEEKPAGTYEVEFNATSLSSGIYFYQLKVYPVPGGAGNYIETRKMVLMK